MRRPLAALLLLLISLLAASACKQQPAARSAYESTPLRTDVGTPCDAATLTTEEGDACVRVDVHAEGEGTAAQAGDWVWIHYMVLVGDVAATDEPIDSSHGGEPLSFHLDESTNMIEGLHEGVRGMRVGERRRFVVPPKLGYRGRKMAKIPPEANLTFLVELIERRSSL